MAINRSGQAWCADISDIPVRRGFLYRVAIVEEAHATLGSVSEEPCGR